MLRSPEVLLFRARAQSRRLLSRGTTATHAQRCRVGNPQSPPAHAMAPACL